MSETPKSNTGSETGGLDPTIHFLGSLQLAGILMGVVMMGGIIAYTVITHPQYAAEVIIDHLNKLDAKVEHAAPITAGIFLGSFILGSLQAQNKNTPIRNYLSSLMIAIVLTGFIIYMICMFL